MLAEVYPEGVGSLLSVTSIDMRSDALEEVDVEDVVEVVDDESET